MPSRYTSAAIFSESRGMTHHSQLQVYDGSWSFMALIGTIQFLKHRIIEYQSKPQPQLGGLGLPPWRMSHRDLPSIGTAPARPRSGWWRARRAECRWGWRPGRSRWSAEPSWIFKMSKFRLAVFVRDDEQLWQNRWRASKNCLVLLIGIMFPKYLQYLMENLERNLGKRWS